MTECVSVGKLYDEYYIMEGNDDDEDVSAVEINSMKGYCNEVKAEDEDNTNNNKAIDKIRTIASDCESDIDLEEIAGIIRTQEYEIMQKEDIIQGLKKQIEKLKSKLVLIKQELTKEKRVKALKMKMVDDFYEEVADIMLKNTELVYQLEIQTAEKKILQDEKSALKSENT